MSTSRCQPSKKLRWFRSMCDKMANEEKLVDLAKKVADGNTSAGNSVSKYKANHFAELIEDAKRQNQKKLDKSHKKVDNKQNNP